MECVSSNPSQNLSGEQSKKRKRKRTRRRRRIFLPKMTLSNRSPYADTTIFSGPSRLKSCNQEENFHIYLDLKTVQMKWQDDEFSWEISWFMNHKIRQPMESHSHVHLYIT